MDYLIFGGVALLALVLVTVFLAICFRVVVPTNDVHIVQSGKLTVSYGRGKPGGNTYYRWPAWVPMFGVTRSILPVSVFDQALSNYAAYDKDRVPFMIDIVGFFRIADTDVAAERVKDLPELLQQLNPILQGAARTILGNSSIDEILGSRALFSEKFTTEVAADLKSWGLEPVKSIELMDIRDAEGSKVIANIMAKKKSFIEMESRVAVAQNSQLAQVAEVEATQTVQMRQQEQTQAVGQRKAQADQEIGIATQKSAQAVAEEEAKTATARMAVVEINQVRAAEIARGVAVVAAEQAKQIAVTTAEGVKAKTITEAEGHKAAQLLEADAVAAKGKAEGEASLALLMAPVSSQAELAKNIGENTGYQKYLIDVRGLERDERVGIAQAQALAKAEIKIVTTAADPASGLNLVTLGTKLGAMVDAFKGALPPSAG